MYRGDHSSDLSAPRALRLMGYASIVFAVVGLAAVWVSVWMREQPDRFQATPQPTRSGSLPVVGAGPTRTRSVPPGLTVQRQPTQTLTVTVLVSSTVTVIVSPTVTVFVSPTPSAAPALPTATLRPTETATATPSPSPLPPAAAPTQAVLSVAQVLAAVPGGRVVVGGTVVEISQFASGVRCTVEDATGRLTLWLSQNVWSSIAGHEAWGVGCGVRAAGTVQLYKDEIELVPQQAAEVILISPAPAAPMVRVGELSSQDVGRQVAIEGTIVEVWPFSQGMKYLFEDGSGRIVVLLWQGVFNDVPDKELLVAGAMIHVSGIVQEYNGQLEIIPGLGHEVSLAD